MVKRGLPVGITKPPTLAVPETERFVEDAFASDVCPVTFNVPDEVRPVVEAVAKVECPLTLSVE